MRSTLIAGAVLASVLMFGALAPSGAHAQSDPCAGHLCKRYVPNTPSCWTHHSRREVSRCFIKRAARHFHQSTRQALAIAYRESRYDYRVTNSSSGAAGLYQFMRGTWRSTPYRKHSRYNPRWASLAAMWMWKHGYQSHWSTY